MHATASEVSAIVLSIGEPSTADALRAVEAQTLPPRDIVVVEHVAPFSRAFNQGIAQVRTPFVVQVDADMVLDPLCFETFYRVAGTNSLGIARTGLVSGFLRDPLLGRICCLKMFSTECAARLPLRDVVSFETDFVERMLAGGWLLLRALNFTRRDPAEWHSFGEHRRDYTPSYTFAKFRIEGRKARLRRNVAALRGRLATLAARRDHIGDIAQIGLLLGLFGEQHNDLLRPFDDDDDWRWLSAYLDGHGDRLGGAATPRMPNAGGPEEAFRLAYRLGHELRSRPAAIFRACLHSAGSTADAWVAQAGLCAGLFADRIDEDVLTHRYKQISDLIRKPPP